MVDGLFSNGPNLDIVNHTATRLNNGTVLVTGGWPNGPTTAELYTSSTLTPPNLVSIAVTPASATLLNNGLVLLAGRVSNSLGWLTSADLYDPATGMFTPTGPMNFARQQPTSTLLNDGTVLITGGYYYPPAGGNALSVATAEIYNPATGVFTYTNGPMGYARSFHTATVLRCACVNDGKVLITGGQSINGTIFDTAELYDPSTQTFAPTGSMATSREEHAATPLNDGTVLITGGQDANFTNLSTAEVYDPVAGTFTAVSTMTDTRSYHTATLLNNGTVLVAGGCCNASGLLLASAEIYTPTTGMFTSTGSMANPHYFQAATLLNSGTVLIAGGCCTTNSAELYDPGSGMFHPTGNLNTARYDFTSTRLNHGDVLVVGGWGGTNTEIYHPSTLTPPNLTSISVAPANPTIAVGEAMRFIATGTYQDNSTQQLASVTWSSSNATIAQITNDLTNSGVGFGVAAETATIQACAGGTCDSTTLTGSPSPNYTQLPATPGGSFGMGMVFVPSDLTGGTNYTLLFEGHSVSTWTFSSGSWTLHSPVNSPSTRDGEGMAYDASTKGLCINKRFKSLW